MKVTFNTSQPEAAASLFYRQALQGMGEVSFYDQDFLNYDVALFMTYDHELIPSIKLSFPHLKIGIIDPRSHQVYPSTQHCDFIIIDSIEMEDYWRRSNLPIFRYVEYPSLPPIKKRNSNDNTIRIGYHGNKIHLNCMSQNVTPALEELGEKHDIKLLVMYNEQLGKPNSSDIWYPKNVSVEFCTWSMEGYSDFLSFADIGIVPNSLIHDKDHKSQSSTAQSFNYSPDDYSLRFKMPSGPGRFIVFGLMGIPVVADFFPSAIKYLQNGTGLVAHSKDGWKYSLEKLIKDKRLREEMGANLKSMTEATFDVNLQNEHLKSFLTRLLKR